VLAGGGGFGNQVDQRELTPGPDVGDFLNTSFFLEPGVLQVQSSASNTDVGVYADDSVVHVGDADGTVATVDTGDRAADEGMMVNVGGFEAVVEGFFADASVDRDTTKCVYVCVRLCVCVCVCVGMCVCVCLSVCTCV